MNIRSATPADLDTVAGIYGHYVEHTVATFDTTPLTVDQWRAKLADLTARGLPFLVADEGGGPVGFAYAGPWRPKPAYLHTVEDTIYLAPGYTGKGLGAALLDALLDACVAAGVRQVVAVIADTGSDASAALHRRLGFSDAGRLAGVGNKHGRWVDTLLMQRDLTGAPTSAPLDSSGA
ncbi:GNAT family N-acetyltransferase [Phytohabitans kaempferiae]|uniref:GNAT family N-acetyltransferase n=1 Tax=Phytohabitans kaempferiae TaxID=1620943 RepID=A0ABV6MA80_9ACTN